ncbi:MAG: heme exporter protein CcmD [Pseudomonadales bacterium]
MYFDSFTQLLHMDGHGVYVWIAFAISVLLIAVCILQPTLRYRSELKRLAASPAARPSADAQTVQR